MVEITNTPRHANLFVLLRVLCRADELSAIRLRCDSFCHAENTSVRMPMSYNRRAEKKTLNSINNAKDADQPPGMEGAHVRLQLRDPEKGFRPRDRVTTAEDKLFVLINEALSDKPAGLEYSLRQEADLVVRHGQRVATAMAK